MLDENTNNLQNQKNITNHFLTLDKVATEAAGTKPSQGSLKLRAVNRLIFGQTNISSTRNKF